MLHIILGYLSFFLLICWTVILSFSLLQNMILTQNVKTIIESFLQLITRCFAKQRLPYHVISVCTSNKWYTMDLTLHLFEEGDYYHTRTYFQLPPVQTRDYKWVQPRDKWKTASEHVAAQFLSDLKFIFVFLQRQIIKIVFNFHKTNSTRICFCCVQR